MPRSDNPIKALRKELALSRGDFGVLLRCSYAEVHVAEAGYRARIPQSILAGLDRIGVDAKGVAESYAAWRREFGEEIAQRTGREGK